MRRFNFLFTFTLLFLVSCGDEYYNTEEVYVNSTTKYYTIDRWTKEDTPPTPVDPDENSRFSYFYCDVLEPALTNEVFDYGIMNAYLTDENDKSIIAPLPFNDYYKTPDGFMWTEHVTCEFSPKYIRFIVKYNDFEMDTPPLKYTFMVRFMW